MKFSIHIDGGSRGNPGPAAAGVVIRRAGEAAPVHEAGYYLGKTTNNVAEYHGLVRALERAVALGAKDVEVISDSELMVKQITGQFRVKSPELQPLFRKARGLLDQIGTWQIRHVRRELNHRADELANQAMDLGRDVEFTTSGKKISAAAESNLKAEALEKVERWWTAELATAPGPKCPAACPAGRPFPFGPDTPPGFCVYAAQVVLSRGPLQQLGTSPSDPPLKCPRCGVAIKIKLLED